MKVRVAFTVEFDEDKFRRSALGRRNDTITDIRYEVKALALNAVLFGLGDHDIEVKLLAEDK